MGRSLPEAHLGLRPLALPVRLLVLVAWQDSLSWLHDDCQIY